MTVLRGGSMAPPVAAAHENRGRSLVGGRRSLRGRVFPNYSLTGQRLGWRAVNAFAAEVAAHIKACRVLQTSAGVPLQSK